MTELEIINFHQIGNVNFFANFSTPVLQAAEINEITIMLKGREYLI